MIAGQHKLCYNGIAGQNTSIITKMQKNYQIPTAGNAGPQSQLNEHACLRMKLKKHSPFCSRGGQAGGT